MNEKELGQKELEKREKIEKLRRLEKGYSQGLNYIDATNKESSLRPKYIDSLKKIRAELSDSTQKEEEPAKKREKTFNFNQKRGRTN